MADSGGRYLVIIPALGRLARPKGIGDILW